MERGEVWWADLAPPIGRRPVLLLSRDKAIQVRPSVTVAPLTRTVRGLPVEVELDERDGMPKACVVNVDDLQTILKRQLHRRICRLGPPKLRAVAAAVRFALALE